MPAKSTTGGVDRLKPASSTRGVPLCQSKSVRYHKSVSYGGRINRGSLAVYPPSEPPQSPENLVKSKQRVADHGEVFTPRWMVDAMLDLVQEETNRIDSRFLEPACGNGNFIIKIVQRKLAAVEAKYGQSPFERRQYSLLAIMSIYGIELLEDNIGECRANVLALLMEYLDIDKSDDLYWAAYHVLSQNLIHGDAMKMQTASGMPITFAEWGYLGKGRFQRRDFRFDVLTQSSSFRAEDSLFGHLGKHEIFQPTREYPSSTIGELSQMGRPANQRSE